MHPPSSRRCARGRAAVKRHRLPRRVACAALLVATAALVAARPSHPAHAPERRCGWLVNDTPGNFELVDRHGRWTIAEQGGYRAEGFADMPDMSGHGWVATNGPHGHGCACMSALVDTAHERVIRLAAAHPVPLARCTRDRRLPRL